MLVIKNQIKQINGKKYLVKLDQLDNGQLGLSVKHKVNGTFAFYYLDESHLDEVCSMRRSEALINYFVANQVPLNTPVIPPSENTDNKIASDAQCGGDSVGVVASEGEALSKDPILRRVERWGHALKPLAGKPLKKEVKDLLHLFPTLMVASDLNKPIRTYPKHPKQTEFLRDDDIPPSFYGLGV